jgi:hypothetical protein
MVNMAKSMIFFSANCDDQMKEEMKNSTGITTEALCEKYLGLPTAVGRNMKEAFEHIPSKIICLMGGWGERLLSCAGRETLIKSVAHAIPHTPRDASFYPLQLAKRSPRPLPTSGGVAKLIVVAYTGGGGPVSLSQNVMGGWVSRMLKLSILLCWANRDGD